MEDQVPARVSDDVVWFVEEEEEVGCVVEKEACAVEEEEAFTLEDEDGFVVNSSQLSVAYSTGGVGGGGISICDPDFVCGGVTKV